MNKMVEEFSARVGHMLVSTRKITDAHTSLHEKLDHLLRELDTLSSEEKRAQEDLKTAERRLRGITDREQDLKMLFERIKRADSACLSPSS
jgi:chaperonin cofactor prefoldin